MDSREHQKHPWKEEAFLIEQLDYIIDRVLMAGAIYVSVTPRTTTDFEKKWETLLQLYIQCDNASKGKETAQRDFLGKFARVLKLITDAYSEACKITDEIDDAALNASPKAGESPRLRSSSKSAESPRLNESPRYQSPRLSSIRRSLSGIKIRPGSPKFKLTGNESPVEIAAFINNDFNKHHYVRILGLLLSEIYRLMDANQLPALRDEDKHSIYYQSAIRLQFPSIEKEEDYDYVRNMYARLKLPTPLEHSPELSRGNTM